MYFFKEKDRYAILKWAMIRISQDSDLDNLILLSQLCNDLLDSLSRDRKNILTRSLINNPDIYTNRDLLKVRRNQSGGYLNWRINCFKSTIEKIYDMFYNEGIAKCFPISGQKDWAKEIREMLLDSQTLKRKSIK